MPDRDRIRSLDQQRATARRYRLTHDIVSGGRLLAAAMIEMRAQHLILRENLRVD